MSPERTVEVNEINKTQRGSSDFAMVAMAVLAFIVVWAIMQMNSCIKDHNRRKNGWVEVDEDYPYDKYISEEDRRKYYQEVLE